MPLSDSEKIAKIKKMIDEHKISCGEDVWQRDSLSEYALEFMEKVCEIIGWSE